MGFKWQRFCSPRCSGLASQKIEWPNDLPTLIAESSQKAVATILGVSDKAVAKRLKNHHKTTALKLKEKPWGRGRQAMHRALNAEDVGALPTGPT